ncbi:hypothetical protein WA026_019101 [Henosepilachna vigintioctopunctata]|uniref:Gustatory receptor n=1 Tax=Henosepilachna vigintioctopunctata TaxID=420089 RepID=A0AAW1VGT1_9CUCU
MVKCLNCQYEVIGTRVLKSQGERINRIFLIKSRINTSANSETEHLEYLIRLHGKICDLVDYFNSIFGINFLLVISSANINILIYASSFAIYALNRGPILQHLDMRTLLEKLAEAVFQLILPIVLVHECSGIAVRRKNLIVTCLSYYNKLSKKRRTQEVKLLQKGIAILCHQAETRMSHFSAGGFFTIDFTMLTMMFGGLTANLIIVLQLTQCSSNSTSPASNSVIE